MSEKLECSICHVATSALYRGEGCPNGCGEVRTHRPPRKWSLATECYAYTDDTHWQGPDIPEGERVEVIEAAPLYALVDEQAEDEGLWSTGLDGSVPIAEAHLRQELRRLHALIESGRSAPAS